MNGVYAKKKSIYIYFFKIEIFFNSPLGSYLKNFQRTWEKKKLKCILHSLCGADWKNSPTDLRNKKLKCISHFLCGADLKNFQRTLEKKNWNIFLVLFVGQIYNQQQQGSKMATEMAMMMIDLGVVVLVTMVIIDLGIIVLVVQVVKLLLIVLKTKK